MDSCNDVSLRMLTVGHVGGCQSCRVVGLQHLDRVSQVLDVLGRVDVDKSWIALGARLVRVVQDQIDWDHIAEGMRRRNGKNFTY